MEQEQGAARSRRKARRPLRAAMKAVTRLIVCAGPASRKPCVGAVSSDSECAAAAANGGSRAWVASPSPSPSRESTERQRRRPAAEADRSQEASAWRFSPSPPPRRRGRGVSAWGRARARTVAAVAPQRQHCCADGGAPGAENEDGGMLGEVSHAAAVSVSSALAVQEQEDELGRAPASTTLLEELERSRMQLEDVCSRLALGARCRGADICREVADVAYESGAVAPFSPSAGSTRSTPTFAPCSPGSQRDNDELSGPDTAIVTEIDASMGDLLSFVWPSSPASSSQDAQVFHGSCRGGDDLWASPKQRRFGQRRSRSSPGEQLAKARWAARELFGELTLSPEGSALGSSSSDAGHEMRRRCSWPRQADELAVDIGAMAASGAASPEPSRLQRPRARPATAPAALEPLNGRMPWFPPPDPSPDSGCGSSPAERRRRSRSWRPSWPSPPPLPLFEDGRDGERQTLQRSQSAAARLVLGSASPTPDSDSLAACSQGQNFFGDFPDEEEENEVEGGQVQDTALNAQDEMAYESAVQGTEKAGIDTEGFRAAEAITDSHASLYVPNDGARMKQHEEEAAVAEDPLKGWLASANSEAEAEAWEADERYSRPTRSARLSPLTTSSSPSCSSSRHCPAANARLGDGRSSSTSDDAPAPDKQAPLAMLRRLRRRHEEQIGE
eukprot:TRINITY_DN14696_c0_g4_i1.p1 TRINITY_DN14696_c0_g4~~TRINITY_DN14696_c0_g4_i1.p1  ORF type:complete len:765 (+),score=174.09 TRINITY_DN14696_c0_g4_i1:279-2297(+)